MMMNSCDTDQEVDKLRHPKNYMKEVKEQKERAEETHPVITRQKPTRGTKVKIEVQPLFQTDPIKVRGNVTSPSLSSPAFRVSIFASCAVLAFNFVEIEVMTHRETLTSSLFVASRAHIYISNVHGGKPLLFCLLFFCFGPSRLLSENFHGTKLLICLCTASL